MLSVALAQTRAHAARMIATVLAIVIAVGFVVATMVLNESLNRTIRDSVAAPYVGADAVLRGPAEDGPNAVWETAGREKVAGQLLEAADRTPGVRAAAVERDGYGKLRTPDGGNVLVHIRDFPADESLRWLALSGGRLPDKAGEAVVDTRADLAVGSRVTVLPEGIAEADGSGGTEEPSPVTVVGVADLSGNPHESGSRQMFVTPEQGRDWGLSPALEVRVLGDPDGSDEELAGLLSRVAGDAGIKEYSAVTGRQAANDAIQDFAGQTTALYIILLVFGGIALLVATLVIANTFSVLIAQRTRELALLRCVGALGRQVRRSVLVEAALVGLTASAAGVAAGIGLAALMRSIIASTDAPLAIDAFAVPPSAVLAGLGLGTVVTVGAAFFPARRATRIAPLAALRPFDAAPIRSARGLLRLGFGFALLIPGALILALAVRENNLLIGMPGGSMTFVGVILLGRRFIPPVVALAGRVVSAGGGVTREMATLGALRNPGRTAATATALLIGVTLTTAMVVGAASVRVTADRMLDEQYPTDLFVGTDGEGQVGRLLADRVADVPGVTATMTVLRGTLQTSTGNTIGVVGMDPAAAAKVVRSAQGAGVPAPGVITVPETLVDSTGGAGRKLTLTPASKENGGNGGTGSLEVTIKVARSGDQIQMAAADLRKLDPKAATDAVWLRVADDLDGDGQAQVVEDVSRVAGQLDPDAYTYGAIQERSGFDDLLTGLLLFVLGLLGVAVFIAVIGVGNTIALSVIERRQELGLLRALGLTRGQLRGTLLWEALLIAGVAATLGTVLGGGYGAIGTICALGGEGDVTVRVPWGQVAAIVAVATLAGAAASVLPSRRAAQVSPVVAIAGT